MFSFMVSLKGTFLEGMEVVFIVITFGLNAHNVPVAVVGAVAAVIVVAILAVSFRKPLAMIPENTMKYGVGLLLASFGTFWAVEGLGVFRSGQRERGVAGLRRRDPGPARRVVPGLPRVHRGAGPDAGLRHTRPRDRAC